MRSLKWSTSHAVFVPEIDDEHKEIFQALSNLQKVLADSDPSPEIHQLTHRLASCIDGHFAHEERLMRAARYGSIRWHQQAHNGARRRVAEFALRIEHGEPNAGTELVAYLTSWLNDHTRLADRMMGAFLRNRQRCMWKVTFQAGTKPLNACAWVDANGDTFDPKASDDPD
jgi:hemerythrin